MGPLISAGQRETVASLRRRRRARGDPRRARPTGPASGSRRPSCARSRNDERAARARRSSGRSPPSSRSSDEAEAVRAGQRHDLRAVGLGLDARRRPRAARGARDRDRRAVDQLEHLGARRHAVRRLQAVRATAASSARTRSTPTPRSRPSSTRPRTPDGRPAGGQGVRRHRRGGRDRRRDRRGASRARARTVVGVDLRDGAPRRPGARRSTSPTRRRCAACTRGSREAFGRIDVLFNNAGISPADDGSVLDTALEAWQRVQDVNLKSVFLCCKHGIPHLLDNERPRGSVINTASFVAVMGAATSQISYTASKGGVLALSRELGVEFARARRARQRAVPGPGRHAAAAGAVRQRPRAGGAAARARADGPLRARRARSPTARCSSPPTSRRYVDRVDVPGRRRPQRRLHDAARLISRRRRAEADRRRVAAVEAPGGGREGDARRRSGGRRDGGCRTSPPRRRGPAPA